MPASRLPDLAPAVRQREVASILARGVIGTRRGGVPGHSEPGDTHAGRGHAAGTHCSSSGPAFLRRRGGAHDRGALGAQSILPAGDLDRLWHGGQRDADALVERLVLGTVAGRLDSGRHVLHGHRTTPGFQNARDVVLKRALTGTGTAAPRCHASCGHTGRGTQDRQSAFDRGELRFDLDALVGQLALIGAQLTDGPGNPCPRWHGSPMSSTANRSHLLARRPMFRPLQDRPSRLP